jgi:hypothetical protein
VSQSPSKLAVLKLGEGDLTSGLSVILQIGDDQARPDLELRGQLAPNPQLLSALETWETQYQNLDFQGRPLGKPGQIAPAPSRRPNPQQCPKPMAPRGRLPAPAGKVALQPSPRRRPTRYSPNRRSHNPKTPLAPMGPTPVLPPGRTRDCLPQLRSPPHSPQTQTPGQHPRHPR